MKIMQLKNLNFNTIYKVVKGPKNIITWLAEEAVLYLHNEDKCYVCNANNICFH